MTSPLHEFTERSNTSRAHDSSTYVDRDVPKESQHSSAPNVQGFFLPAIRTVPLNWQFLWSLLLTQGSRKLSSVQYSSIRDIVNFLSQPHDKLPCYRTLQRAVCSFMERLVYARSVEKRFPVDLSRSGARPSFGVHDVLHTPTVASAPVLVLPFSSWIQIDYENSSRFSCFSEKEVQGESCSDQSFGVDRTPFIRDRASLTDATNRIFVRLKGNYCPVPACVGSVVDVSIQSLENFTSFLLFFFLTLQSTPTAALRASLRHIWLFQSKEICKYSPCVFRKKNCGRAAHILTNVRRLHRWANIVPGCFEQETFSPCFRCSLFKGL